MHSITDFFTYNYAFFVGNGILMLAAIATSLEKHPTVRKTIRISFIIGTCFIIFSAVPTSGVLFRVQIVLILLLMAALHFGSRTLAPARMLLRIFIIAMAYFSIKDYNKDQIIPRIPSNSYTTIFALGSDISAVPSSWVSHLEQKLSKEIVNISSVDTTLINAIDQVELLPDNDILLLTCLGREVLETKPDLKQFEDTLHVLFRELARGNRTVVMFELPSSVFNKAYLQKQRVLARTYGFKLIPRKVLFSILDKETSTDGTLSSSGQKKIAQIVATILQ